ncbi:MAG: hypothetical protein J7501_07075 [Bdellovibrio sp.]|nr:hypothetical protein [Bdellovibrio sp.]
MRKTLSPRLDFTYLIWFGVPVLLYQILISRILSQIFGSLFFIQLFLIAVAYLGTALGSYWSLRLHLNLSKSHGWLVILNLILLGFNHWSTELLKLETLSLILGFALFFAISFVSSLLLPLFFEEQKRQGLETTTVFNRVYFYFHLLVVAALIFVELGVLHTWGIQTILWILTAAEFFWSLYWRIQCTEKAALAAIPLRSLKDELYKSKDLIAPLFAFSVISGIIQSILYRQVQNVLAPLAFHYSLYLAALVLSWALSSLWFRSKRGYRWLNWLRFKQNSGLLVLALLVWSLSWPVFWSVILDHLTLPPASLYIFVIRASFALGLILPTGFFFGSLLPLVKKENEHIPLGTYLSVNSLGNALGILLFISFLFEVTGIFQLWSLLGLACLIFALRTPKAKTVTATGVVVLCLLTYFLTKEYSWDLGSYPHRSFNRWVQDTHSLTDVKTFKHRSSQVSFVEINHRYNLMIMNGHHSINLPKDNEYSLSDTLMGLTPLPFVKNFDKALVIGLGTGATAMGSAATFNHTDIVDLDPTMLQVVEFMKPVAQRLHSKKVKFIEADGLTFLRTNQQSYDLIINNVPSPVYFTAAKLWSREALQSVYDSLTEDGIFAQWLDGELTPESLDILMQTSQGLFTHCDMFFLNYNFYSLVCSKGDKPLTLKTHPEIAATLMQTTPELYSQFFEGLRWPAVPIKPQHKDVPMNTLDRPYMDVLVAISPPGWLNNDKVDHVAARFELPQLLTPQPGKTFPPEMEKKCRLMAEWIYHHKFQIFGEQCAPLF